MGREWKIGDPVDYTSDGWMDAQNWTGDYYIEKDDLNKIIDFKLLEKFNGENSKHLPY